VGQSRMSTGGGVGADQIKSFFGGLKMRR
jgi:hypothetical protein